MATTIFPETMSKLDPGDVAGSFSKLENYIRYMTERMEFSNRNMSRSVNVNVTNTEDVILMLADLTDAVAYLQTSVNTMSGDLTAANNRVTAMQKDVEALTQTTDSAQERITALQASVDALKQKADSAQESITALQASVEALDQRVAALEGGMGG